MNSKKYSLKTILLFVVFGTTRIIFARSVYVINDTHSSILQAYKIDGNSLTYQIGYTCLSDPLGSIGAVGIAIDESDYGNFLFVTIEDQDEIELVNAKFMEFVDVVTAPGATNLAGIAMDKGKNKLYAVDRYTNHLYSYSWNRNLSHP